MRRHLPVVLLAALAIVGGGGCFKMNIEAPRASGDYVLGSDEQPASTKVKRRCWYLFWGMVPVSSISSGDVIKRLPPGYRVVKLQTTLDATSFFVALFTLGLAGSTNIIVEGVAPPKSPGSPLNPPVPATLPP